MMKTVENEVKNLIASNKIRDAITKMVDYVADKDSEIQNSLILLSSQVQSIQSLLRQSLIKLEEYNMQEAKINVSALAVCEEIIAQGYFNQEPTNIVQNEEAIKILFLSADPVDGPELKIGNEYLDVRRNLRKSKIKFKILEDLDTDLGTFLETIWLEKPTIIHFAGISSPDGIVLNDDNKKMSLIPYDYLAATFRLFKENTKCVIFNAGHSHDFAKKISDFIPYVVGVNCVDILDDEAIAFTNGFYTSLAFEEDYEKAFLTGYNNIKSRKKDAPNPYIFYNKSVKFLDKTEELVAVIENKK